jgi:hypothetical protein
MSVQLLAIKFNHDSTSADSDALNIRRNAMQFVNVPEWQRSVSINPEDSPAAYSIAQTAGHTITIHARFRRTDPQIQAAEIRALDAGIEPPGQAGCLRWLLWLLRAILRALFGNVLGEVRARQVAFQASGETAFEVFELKHVRLWSVGVVVRDTTWRWQYRLLPGDPWTDFDSSRHRISSLLEVPTAPWQQAPHAPGSVQLPWTEVLDYACRWASLATSRDEAARRVTRAVYDLGPATVTYDCPGGGSTHYAWGGFNCTAFLERLRGGIGNGQFVNCTDCATFVSTFSNALGSDLWQSRMGYGFALNAGLSIGSNVWQTACNWGGFSYHEIAWKGACTSNEEVFDACLRVDGDADPTSAPHTPLLPVNLLFGDPGDGVYRDRLCTIAGRPSCNPQPGTRVRRAVS